MPRRIKVTNNFIVNARSFLKDPFKFTYPQETLGNARDSFGFYDCGWEGLLASRN